MKKLLILIDNMSEMSKLFVSSFFEVKIMIITHPIYYNLQLGDLLVDTVYCSHRSVWRHTSTKSSSAF